MSAKSGKKVTPSESANKRRRMLDETLAYIPGWLGVAGLAGWLFVGAAGAIAIGAWLLAASSSISIPLLLAAVLGIVFAPVVDWLERRMPRAAATAIVLVGLLAVGTLTVWLVARGLFLQWPAIQDKLQTGIAVFAEKARAAGWDLNSFQRQAQGAVKNLGQSGSSGTTGLVSGVFSAVGRSLSGAFGFVFGLFIAVVLFFYVLQDYAGVSEWTAGHMGLPTPVGRGVIDDASFSLRGYVRGTTITGLVVAAVIALGAIVLRVPLPLPIFIVTFLTCYIPFFGAIISGIFAFVVALGGAGLTQAIILLIIVLVAQNVLQLVINAQAIGDSLDLHPLVILVVTMLGGIFGGLLGATLAAPLTALALRATRRIREAMAAEKAAAG